MQTQGQLPQGAGNQRITFKDWINMMIATFIHHVMTLAVGVYQLNPKYIMKLLLYILLIICFTPTGFLFPTPLFPPKHKVVTVPTYESMDVMIYSLRRPREVKAYSYMTEPNRDYLVRSWTEKKKPSRSDISNGFFPPYPAMVFIQDPKDVALHEANHEDDEQKKLGRLTFDVLDKIGEVNGGKMDLWVVSPKNAEELNAFFKEFCWYRQVSIVTFGSADMLTLNAMYNNHKGNMFPVFLNGMIMVDPQFDAGFTIEFSDDQKLLLSGLRVTVAGTYSDEAKTVLEKLFPETLTNTEVDAAPSSPEFVKLVKGVYGKWKKK